MYCCKDSLVFSGTEKLGTSVTSGSAGLPITASASLVRVLGVAFTTVPATKLSPKACRIWALLRLVIFPPCFKNSEKTVPAFAGIPKILLMIVVN